ncbi:MAG TPA: hypothetical protein VJU16_03885 [Planctomycetota bacterium]|nr:hypothetical protein [Planctomycetota bacterium]
MSPWPLLAAVLLLPQEPNEAEELLRKAEAAVANAPSFRRGYEVTAQETVTTETSARRTTRANSGTFDVLGGNGLKLKAHVLFGPLDNVHVTVQSDGKTARVKRDTGAVLAEVPAPGRLKAEYTVLLLRLGAESAASETANRLARIEEDNLVKAAGLRPKPRDPDPVPQVTDFKMAGREKIGDVETVKIRFTMKATPGSDPSSVTLWLDAKTFLPVQREEEIDRPNLNWKHVERYAVPATPDSDRQ